MTQSYNTSSIKSSNKKAKNSEKEFLDNNQIEINEDIGGYFRLIPAHIFDDPELLDKERLLYGLLMGLCKKFGFSWATNKFLAKELHVTPRQIPKYLKRLSDRKLVFIEILHNFERKIWVAETYHMRDRIQKVYRNEPEFNQRFDRYDLEVMGGMTWRSCISNRYSNRVIKKDNTERKPRESKDTPPSSAIIFLKIGENTGITEEEFNKLSLELGEKSLMETIVSMRNWVSEPGTKREFRQKNLPKKIKDWNRRFQRAPKIEKERSEAEENKRKFEKTKNNNLKLIDKVLCIKEWKNKLKIFGNNVSIDNENRDLYNLADPGLERFLENILAKRLE